MKGATTRQRVARGGSVTSERERGMHFEKTIRRRAPCRTVFSTTFLYPVVFFRGMIFFGPLIFLGPNRQNSMPMWIQNKVHVN